MKNTQVLMDDATCYESYIKYPTDVKLLFDCYEWLMDQIISLCEQQQIRKPRMVYKYSKQRAKHTSFQKRKKKTYRQIQKRRRELLYWVEKSLEGLQQILNSGSWIHTDLRQSFYDRIKTIKAIHAQQEYLHHHPGGKVSNRIVSLYKPYIRPIVRGKETKRVEFGAKVHISQVDQINFIEHLSFEAFHEGKRMWKSLFKHNRRFKRCRQYAADEIYATNKNRKPCSRLEIHTCFKRKGRVSQLEDQKQTLRQTLGKGRATVLEGSFGNEKNHYLLGKVKARKECTEVVWIIFGIHTANAVKISKRIQLHKDQEKHKRRSSIAS